MSRGSRGGRGVAVVVAVLLVLTGCQSSSATPSGSVSQTSGTTSRAPMAGAPGEGVAVAAAPPTLTLPVGIVPYDEPVVLRVDGGRIETATVRSDAGSTLTGVLDSQARLWSSARPPQPGESYAVAVAAAGTDGVIHQLTGRFSVATLPARNRLTLAVTPRDGEVVGVGAPVVVRFDQAVTDRAAVERALVVAASAQVTGAWHWVNDREVHFRPEKYWPSGTSVAVRLELTGVRAGPGLWGGRDYVTKFTVGASHISVIDGAKHTMTVTVDGRTTATWPVSLGQPAFATRTGTYVVLSKDRVRRMTSCSANITCSRSNPNWYDLPVYWTVRLTWSGTFVHAAPWSVSSQGRANVSHGCINLSVARGKAYYEMSRYGDVVTVVNTSRKATDLVAKGDPGMADWNVPWSTYVDASALHRTVLTAPLQG